jgi:hypothetical protein
VVGRVAGRVGGRGDLFRDGIVVRASGYTCSGIWLSVTICRCVVVERVRAAESIGSFSGAIGAVGRPVSLGSALYGHPEWEAHRHQSNHRRAASILYKEAAAVVAQIVETKGLIHWPRHRS